MHSQSTALPLSYTRLLYRALRDSNPYAHLERVVSYQLDEGHKFILNFNLYLGAEGFEPSTSHTQNGHDTYFVTPRFRVCRDSNPESVVYKTTALPIKLHTLYTRPGLESNQ